MSYLDDKDCMFLVRVLQAVGRDSPKIKMKHLPTWNRIWTTGDNIVRPDVMRIASEVLRNAHA